MYNVSIITELISEAIKLKRRTLILPSGKVVRLSKTLKTFYYRGVVCAFCGIEGIRFREVKHSNKTHLQLFGSKDNVEILMTCDHIIPQSKGGSSSFFNLQTLCYQCNSDKKDLIDQTIVDNAQYSYKSIKDYVFNNYPQSPLRSKFSREFSRIQATKKSTDKFGFKCGGIDETLQLLYYIQNKYGYKIRLQHLRSIPLEPIGVSDDC